MAKGARASTIKSNNARLKRNVFGPVETARTERLSQKLLELARQPKPKLEIADVNMEADADNAKAVEASKSSDGMEIDSKPTVAKKGRVEKRRTTTRSKASIVFPKYNKGKKAAAPRRKR